jgi:pimeloyl-ACP methyl ester carboxylesterase
MSRSQERLVTEQEVDVRAGPALLGGTLGIPENAQGLVLFAHGSGSSRHSPRNRFVAGLLREGGLATLLFDLLTAREDEVDRRTGQLRFEIDLLAERLILATEWALGQAETQSLRMGYFGSSTGAAAALVAVAQKPELAHAVVSRGGRPDLAGPALTKVHAPTLLIVGGDDVPVIDLNRQALARLAGEKEIEIVPGATHLFEEPGALETVAQLARDWFRRYL